LRGSWSGRRPPASAKVAVTHVEVLSTVSVDVERWTESGGGRVSLVSCRLETGRQHQIRIHLAETGHPLVGEKVYIRDYAGGFVRGFEPGNGRPLLHAHTLGFVHPQDDRSCRFEAPLPADFRRLIEALGLPDPTGENG
jgi:23S rRNA pseudouridine1911/1915/1917 synthase